MADIDNSANGPEAGLFRLGRETGIGILLDFGPEMRVGSLVDAIKARVPQMDEGTARAVITSFEKQGDMELGYDAIARFPAGSPNAEDAKRRATERAEKVRRRKAGRKAAG
jgi:hypothetical protein